MKDHPLVKFAIYFILGIILQKYFSFQPVFCYLIIVTAIIILLALIRIKPKNSVFISLIAGIIILLCGNFIAEQYLTNQTLLPSNIYRMKDIKVFGSIDNIELNKSKGIVFYLTSDSLRYRENKADLKTKFICRINLQNKNEIDSIYSLLNIGNKVKISGNFDISNGKGNPGEFDFGKYLRSKGISGTISSNSSKNISIINYSKDNFQAFVFNARKYLDNKISELHSAQTASLIKGLLLADRSEISQETKTEFINSGVMHVLAVSGLHVGYIIVIFYFLFGRLNIYFRSIMILSGLIIFMILTGLPSSVVRAVIMAGVMIITNLTNRFSNIFNSLALAAIIILFFVPSEIFNPGFQLSFVSVFSIGAIYPVFQSNINLLKIKSKVLKKILGLIAISLSAQIGTLPFILIYFNKLSLAALIANIVVIPVIGLIVGIALFTIVLSIILPYLAALAALTNNIVCALLFKFIHTAGELKYSFIWIRGFTLTDSIIFYSLILLLFFGYKYFNKIISKTIFISLIFADILMYCPIEERLNFPKNLLSVFMVDVGQGDSFLIRFPNGKTGLVDAGSATLFYDTGEKTITPLLEYFNIPKINFAFISHFDSDHYGGIVSLIKNDKIEKVFITDIDTSSVKEKLFIRFLDKKKVPYETYTRKIFPVGNARIYFLNDSPKHIGKKVTSNNRSGLLKIVYGKTGILFTGDIDETGENYYTSRDKNIIASDILKISHHGSGKGSSEKFLNFVRPKISLISVGIKNRFGHPSAEVINRLKSINSKIYRTDLDGGIILITNGESIYPLTWEN